MYFDMLSLEVAPSLYLFKTSLNLFRRAVSLLPQRIQSFLAYKLCAFNVQIVRCFFCLTYTSVLTYAKRRDMLLLDRKEVLF